MAFPTAFLASLRGGTHPAAALSIVALLFSGCVVPTAVTIALFRSGRATTLDLNDRRDRAIPSLVTALGCAMAWYWIWMSGAPRSIADLALGVAVQTALLAGITLRWKVSYHSASAVALVMVSRPLGDYGLTLGLSALAVSIAWARVHQRRHTLAQVAVGAMTAVPIALLV
jgi:hypothetical protein